MRLLYFFVVLTLLSSCENTSISECTKEGKIVLRDGESLENCFIKGTLVIAGKNITVNNVVVDATGFEMGIDIRPGSSSIKVLNCEAYGAWKVGIGTNDLWPISVENVLIENCTAHHNLGSSFYTDNWSGSGIALIGVRNSVIRNCEAWENGQLTNSKYKNGPVGIWLANAENSSIEFCYSHDNKTRRNHADGGGFDLDGGTINCSIIGCKSENNAGPGFLVYNWADGPETKNLTIRGCISKNDKEGLLVGFGKGGDIEGVLVEDSHFEGRVAAWIRNRAKVTVNNSYFCGELKIDGFMGGEGNEKCSE